MNGFLHFVQLTGLWLCIFISGVEKDATNGILSRHGQVPEFLQNSDIQLFLIIFSDHSVSVCLLLTNFSWLYRHPFDFLMQFPIPHSLMQAVHLKEEGKRKDRSETEEKREKKKRMCMKCGIQGCPGASARK